jgi:hypothetical protein
MIGKAEKSGFHAVDKYNQDKCSVGVEVGYYAIFAGGETVGVDGQLRNRPMMLLRPYMAVSLNKLFTEATLGCF